MESNFKRALVGYKLEEVQEKINRLNDEHQNEIKAINCEIEQQHAQVVLLRESLEKTKKEMDSIERFEKDIGNALFKAHLDAAKAVYTAKKSAEEQEKSRIDMEKSYENEYMRLKKTVKNLMNELQEKVDEYKYRLGASNNEKNAGGNVS